jgi:hypothetical protein
MERRKIACAARPWDGPRACRRRTCAPCKSAPKNDPSYGIWIKDLSCRAVRDCCVSRPIAGHIGRRRRDMNAVMWIAAQDTPIIKKSNARVANRTDASDFSQPYLGRAGARRLSAAAPDHGGSWGWFSTSVLRCSVAWEDSGTQFALLLTTASLERMKTSE